MEVNWSTFFMEIVNFLILVWILKRFLYKPVMEAIAARRSGIEQDMQAAHRKDQEAQTLKSQYEHRMEDWEKEKQAAREQLHDEIEQERQRLQAQLQADIEQEREKAHAIATQQQQEQQRHYQQQALQNSVRFTSKLLGEVASAELEARLLDKLLIQLQAMPANQRQHLSQALNAHEVTAQVLTAFPLEESLRKKLQQALQDLSEQPVHCEYKQDKNLLAGARIQLGPWLLHANLQDELQVFAEFEQNTPLPTSHE